MAHHKVKNGELVKASRFQMTVDTFFARNEPPIIRVLDATTRFFVRVRAKPVLKLLSRLIGLVLSTGEVVTTERAIDFIDAISALGNTEIAVGPCLCQKALGKRRGTYLKDIMILYGAESYKKAFPQEYKDTSAEETKALLRKLHQESLVITFFACLRSEGWLYSICGCESEICFPFRAHQAAGSVLYPGPDIVAYESESCVGCGNCVECCHFGANTMADGRSRVDFSKCYGCGVCITTCNGQARTMAARTGYRHHYYPMQLVNKATA